MPTPSDNSFQPANPATSSRSSFTSCPPEDDRDRRATREERVTSGPGASPDPSEIETTQNEDENGGNEDTTLSRPGREPYTETNTTELSQSPARPDKGDHLEDSGMLADPPSPTVGSPDAPSDSDARLAQFMSTTAITNSTTPPSQYLYFPGEDKHRVSGSESEI